MGESAPAGRSHAQLANLDPYLESVPINHPAAAGRHSPIASVARRARPPRICPHGRGRPDHDAQGDGAPVGWTPSSAKPQALCFLAGANSIFYGEKLLTTGNPDVDADRALFAKLGLVPAG
jgi:biotin synthase